MRRIFDEQRAEVLAVVLRVVLAAAVAEPDVEHPVGAGDHLAALVVRVRLLRPPAAARRARRHRDVAVHRVLVDVRVVRRIGVVDVELRSVGRERDAEQSFLVAVRERADGEHRCRATAGRRRRRSRTRPVCSATNMCVSCARHASAIGLSRPDTTRRRARRARARGRARSRPRSSVVDGRASWSWWLVGGIGSSARRLVGGDSCCCRREHDRCRRAAATTRTDDERVQRRHAAAGYDAARRRLRAGAPV